MNYTDQDILLQQKNAERIASNIPQPAKRAGLVPARLHSQRLHRLTAKLAIDRPTLPTSRRHPTHLNAGASAYFTVFALADHPEHPEHRTWVCAHAECRGQHFATEEELIAAHPKDAVLRQTGECHAYYCVLDVPAEGPRPAIVMLLTPEEAA